MSSDSRHVDDLIDAYALGALEPAEVDAVERHLAECDACRALYEQARAVAGDLLLAAPPVAPPPSLHARVLAHVHAEAQANAAQARGEPQAAAPRPAEPSPGPLARFFRGIFGGEGEERDRAGELLRDLLAEPDVVIVPVAGTEHAAQASARFVGARSRRDGVLVTNGLAPLPAGQAYQVWFLRGGQPLPNTVFTVNRKGQGASVVRAAEPLAGFDMVAVTPEPASGSPAPTGPIVLAGALRAAG